MSDNTTLSLAGYGAWQYGQVFVLMLVCTGGGWLLITPIYPLVLMSVYLATKTCTQPLSI